MKGKHKRSDKIADLMKRELCTLFSASCYRLHDQRLQDVSILDVEFPKGAAQAKVYYGLNDHSLCQEVRQLLIKAKGFIRHYLCEQTELRAVPQIHFVFDDTIEHGMHIQSLIDASTSDIPDSDEQADGASK